MFSEELHSDYSEEVHGEIVETCTVWAVYTFPCVAKLYAFGDDIDSLIELFGRGIAEVTFMTDGTEKFEGQCAPCHAFGFRGECPGPEAHTFLEWHLESARTTWYPVEMGAFEVPADYIPDARMMEVTRLIAQKYKQGRLSKYSA